MEADGRGIVAAVLASRDEQLEEVRTQIMKKLACLVALALLVPTSVAGAQALQDTYRGESQVLGEVGAVEPSQQPQQAPGAAPAPAAAPAAAQPQQAVAPAVAQQERQGALPFTGSELLLAGLLGLALVAAGFGLRRLSSRPA
jgi:pyruvate/2-oxoglutarate dehydrogenase complex dihydrolipoamide acyltransferase (E2) component